MKPLWAACVFFLDMRKILSKPLPSELLLDLLLVLFEEARGSGDLAQCVGGLRGREVPLATFYRQLQKAVDQGWVEIDEGSETVGSPGPGRPERLYRITDVGRTALQSGMERQQQRVARAYAVGLLTERAK